MLGLALAWPSESSHWSSAQPQGHSSPRKSVSQFYCFALKVFLLPASVRLWIPVWIGTALCPTICVARSGLRQCMTQGPPEALPPLRDCFRLSQPGVTGYVPVSFSSFSSQTWTRKCFCKWKLRCFTHHKSPRDPGHRPLQHLCLNPALGGATSSINSSVSLSYRTVGTGGMPIKSCYHSKVF